MLLCSSLFIFLLLRTEVDYEGSSEPSPAADTSETYETSPLLLETDSPDEPEQPELNPKPRPRSTATLKPPATKPATATSENPQREVLSTTVIPVDNQKPTHLDNNGVHLDSTTNPNKKPEPADNLSEELPDSVLANRVRITDFFENPLPGIRVISQYSGEDKYLHSSLSNAEGLANIAKYDIPINILATGDNFAPAGVVNIRPNETSLEKPIQMTMITGTTLYGQVVDEAGEPLDGVIINAYMKVK